MSWNIHTPEPVNAEDAAKLTPDLTAVTFVDDAQKKATNQQVKAAQAAVAALLKGVGGKKDLYYVTMSGHANPNHAPLDGWADELISVSVSQVPVPE